MRLQCSESTSAGAKAEEEEKRACPGSPGLGSWGPALMMVTMASVLMTGLHQDLLSHRNVLYKSPGNPDEGSTLGYWSC